jgi:precorrin-6B methylase 1
MRSYSRCHSRDQRSVSFLIRRAKLNVIIRGTVTAGLEPSLRANQQKVAVIIATDGESSDGDIATAMAPLAQLPVWVVIRLCTNDEKIVNYWNNIDQQLGTSSFILSGVLDCDWS